MAVRESLQQLKQDLAQLVRSGSSDTSAADVRTMFLNALDTIWSRLSPIKKIFLNNVLQEPDAEGNLNLVVAADTTAIEQDVAILQNHIAALQALINGDDVNLDSVKEISDYIKANKALIDSVTTDKVSTSAIHNALDQVAAGKILDARQGKVLKDQVGILSQLQTTAKTSLVAAINENSQSIGSLDADQITLQIYKHTNFNGF